MRKISRARRTAHTTPVALRAAAARASHKQPAASGAAATNDFRARLAMVAVLAGCLGCYGGTTIDSYPCPPAGTELTYENFGEPFLSQHCQSCHASDSDRRNGAPERFAFDTHADAIDLADRIFARAADGNTSMPPGPDDPSAQERDLLAQWLACGAP